jgi:protocatechuate 3,4-dioxygenase beta subunit
MKRVYQIGLIAVLCNFLTSCNGQTNESNKTTDKSQSVGGAFENSEFTYYGIPKTISSIDTSAGWKQNGQKILITGIVYQIDGKTPAPDVLLYYYQTNTDGKYLHKTEEKSKYATKRTWSDTRIHSWLGKNRQGRKVLYLYCKTRNISY